MVNKIWNQFELMRNKRDSALFNLVSSYVILASIISITTIVTLLALWLLRENTYQVFFGVLFFIFLIILIASSIPKIRNQHKKVALLNKSMVKTLRKLDGDTGIP